jgi:hypothetical protein
MEEIQRINQNLFNIYLLFTREPFVKYFTRELEFYANADRRLLGLITLDLTDNDYSAIVFSRDKTMQYRAERIQVSMKTIDEARDWIHKKMNEDTIIMHEEKLEFFDLFKIQVTDDKLHHHFKILNELEGYQSAKEVIKEISYHYKDIDGNFIEQFQSLNGFDSRLWELYLFCFCREEMFSFKRVSNVPDFIIDKLGQEIAIEAVTVGRAGDNLDELTKKFDKLISIEEIEEKLKDEMPLKFGSSIFDKMKKEYWKLSHVKGKPFLIAIADFHEGMSMTWSFPAIIDYLYGTRYSFHHEKTGKLVIEPHEIKEFKKKSGTRIPAGFFFQPNSENVSAVIFSSTATLSKFSRMGKQAGLGSPRYIIIREGFCYNHDEDASKPNYFKYEVTEDCKELWSEGISIFHNPNANIPLDKDLFPSVAHHEFRDGLIHSDNPDFLPYNSMNYIVKNAT